jgi:hypothetical protein
VSGYPPSNPPQQLSVATSSVPPASGTVATLIERVKNEQFASRQVEYITSAMPTIPSLTSAEAKEIGKKYAICKSMNSSPLYCNSRSSKFVCFLFDDK